MFCPRIDDVEYVEHETVLMVNNIRNYGGSTGIGIIFSGRHILAVAVDDNIVRCSQPLFFHDAKMNIMDGFLLATHLLSPHLTTNKLPWMQTSLERTVIGGLNSKLPYELAREIAFYLDHDSYQNLTQVSRLFRGTHAKYPRVGNLVLLDYAGNGNCSTLQTTTRAVRTLYLQRREPFLNHYKCLSSSFQHISYGPHNLYPTRYAGIGIIRGAETVYKATLRHGVRHHGHRWSRIHSQVVHGIWDFVSITAARSNFPGEIEYDEMRDFRPGRGAWHDYHW
ncbi:hypothetical protein FRC12_007484 [Ceratobasidium sp. 428]|nr:hypothetical protein FRC12_007484 [Ceratobasidium sp. 428]